MNIRMLRAALLALALLPAARAGAQQPAFRPGDRVRVKVYFDEEANVLATRPGGTRCITSRRISPMRGWTLRK